MFFPFTTLGFLCLFVCAPNLSFSASIQKSEWHLSVGEQRYLRIPGLVRYSLNSSAVRSIRPAGKTGDGLLLRAVQKGSAELWVWKQDGSSESRTIQVHLEPSHIGVTPLQKGLSHLEEAEVFNLGDRVVIRGVIHSRKEWTRIADLARLLPQSITDESEPSEDLRQGLKSEIERYLSQTPALRKLQLNLRGSTFIIEGSLSDPNLRRDAYRKIRNIDQRVIFDWDRFQDGAGTVFFQVHLLEMKKDTLRTLGVSWPGKIENAFQISPVRFAGNPEAALNLNHLESEGKLKILSNPQLAVRIPGEAELFAGGEIPIRNQGRFHSNVNWKNYGLTLKLKVTESSSSLIRLEIQTEMSHLDNNLGSEGVPGLRASRMKSQVEARMGVPLLLSGLLQNSYREISQGLPFLKSLPVLGKLFGSDEFQSERSELVAILYPERALPEAPLEKVTSPIPKGEMPLPRNHLSPAEQASLRASPEYPWNALQ